VKFSIGKKTSCVKCTKRFFGKTNAQELPYFEGKKNQKLPQLPHLDNDFLGVVRTK
jgi:hypothetical protein